MIRLEVQEFCEECPDFKSKTEKDATRRDADGVLCRDTIIYCKHRDRCRAMAGYLRRRIDS